MDGRMDLGVINKHRKYQNWSNLFKRFLKIEIGYEGRFSKG